MMDGNFGNIIEYIEQFYPQFGELYRDLINSGDKVVDIVNHIKENQEGGGSAVIELIRGSVHEEKVRTVVDHTIMVSIAHETMAALISDPELSAAMRRQSVRTMADLVNGLAQVAFWSGYQTAMDSGDDLPDFDFPQ